VCACVCVCVRGGGGDERGLGGGWEGVGRARCHGCHLKRREIGGVGFRGSFRHHQRAAEPAD
jgi:hypothetical protein